MVSGRKGLDHRLRVYEDVAQLIASPENPTPMVRINKINHTADFQIYLKLERYNPFGSVKDRIAYEMLSALKRDGKTIVEPSFRQHRLGAGGTGKRAGDTNRDSSSERHPGGEEGYATLPWRQAHGS